MMSKVQLSCRLMTVNQRCSNFVVIEAAKGGTSSLKRVLKNLLVPTNTKERKSAMAPLVTLL